MYIFEGGGYFLYDGSTLLAEMDVDGNLTTVNTWGANGLLSRRVDSATTYYAFDPQGSVAARLSASQSIVSSDLYDAYGLQLAGGASEPYGYGGQWGYYTDTETSLILCTHRYYDPEAGRWLTRDPIGYDGGMNLYGYVGGNPANRADLEGRKGWKLGNPFKFIWCCYCTSKIQNASQKCKRENPDAYCPNEDDLSRGDSIRRLMACIEHKLGKKYVEKCLKSCINSAVR